MANMVWHSQIIIKLDIKEKKKPKNGKGINIK